VSSVTSVLQRCGATLASVWLDAGINYGRRIEERSRALAAYAAPEDWVINADVDEFHEYPIDLVDLVDHCERNGFDHVNGELIDRVAADGSLPMLDERPLGQQFPMEVLLTRNILRGDCRKVALSRASVVLVPGHHRCVGPRVSPCPSEQILVRVHHFKWDFKVLERLRLRIEDIKREGGNWWDESETFLRFVEGSSGVLDLSDPLLEARPAVTAGPFPLQGTDFVRHRG
jgi:hypothetical protein